MAVALMISDNEAELEDRGGSELEAIGVGYGNTVRVSCDHVCSWLLVKMSRTI